MSFLYELQSITTFDGETYDLTDGLNRFVLTTPGNFGMPPIQYQTKKSYKQDGVTETGYTLNPRPFSLQFRHKGCSRDQLWEIRSALIDILRPNRGGQMTYNIVRSDGRKFSIDARSYSPSFEEKPNDQWDEWSFTELLQFEAFNPIWYETDLIDEVVVNQVAGELVFPITFDDNNIYFEDASSYGTLAITYTGTWYSYPVFTIHAPFSRIQIVHEELSKSITLLYSATSGYVTIDLEQLLITNNLNANLFNYLDPMSDLQAFKITPDPELTGGINTLAFFLPDYTIDTQIEVSYKNRYIGI